MRYSLRGGVSATTPPFGQESNEALLGKNTIKQTGMLVENFEFNP